MEFFSGVDETNLDGRGSLSKSFGGVSRFTTLRSGGKGVISGLISDMTSDTRIRYDMMFHLLSSFGLLLVLK
ncbi:hypothetical protein U1Q18_043592, partial [Sarracenia purpurea var. burkii]